MLIPTIVVPHVEKDEDFDAFRRMVNSSSVSGNTLLFDARWASGRLARFTVSDGLNICVWDFNLRIPTQLTNLPVKNAVNKEVSLIFVLQPQACQLRRIGNHSQFYRADHPFQLSIPRSTVLQFQVTPQQGTRIVEMHIGEQYLETTPGNSLCNLAETLFSDAHPFIEFRLCSQHTLSRLETLADMIRIENGSFQKISSLCADLILNTFGNMPISEQPHLPSIYEERMLMLEDLINTRLCGRLPPQATIASQVGMSLSTMKRHFKMQYGSNIYEYYLARKMSLAKKLLQEQQLSVNAIAEMLNYESVSNFIESFKKHHGFSPGRMKKR